MKKLYFLLLISLLVASCKDDDDNNNNDKPQTEVGTDTISIVKQYPHSFETDSLLTVDEEIKKLFSDKSFIVNSKEELKGLAIYNHYPDSMKTDLDSFDFDTHSLIIITNTSLYPTDSIEFTIEYDLSTKTYMCKENLLTQNTNVDPGAFWAYFIVNSLSIKKIPSNSKFTLNVSLTPQ